VHGHSESAHVIFLHGLAQLQVLGALDIQKAGAAPDHEQLADFFLERELVQRPFRPAFAVAREFDAGGWGGLGFIFIFGENG